MCTFRLWCRHCDFWASVWLACGAPPVCADLIASTSGQGESHRTHRDDVQTRLGSDSEADVLGQTSGNTSVDNTQKINLTKLGQGRSQMVHNCAAVHVPNLVHHQDVPFLSRERRRRDTNHMRENPDIYEISDKRQMGVYHTVGHPYSPFDASVPLPVREKSEFYSEQR